MKHTIYINKETMDFLAEKAEGFIDNYPSIIPSDSDIRDLRELLRKEIKNITEDEEAIKHIEKEIRSHVFYRQIKRLIKKRNDSR